MAVSFLDRINSIQMALSKNVIKSNNGFVVDGYDRELAGMEAAIRSKVEDQYAEEWRMSGLIKRWILRRRIEREISEQVAQASEHISPDSLF